MPIRINEAMPVVQRLREEQIFVMPESRAATQDIRELEIAILNIMPNKENCSCCGFCPTHLCRCGPPFCAWTPTATNTRRKII